jgi:hypothetical protein
VFHLDKFHSTTILSNVHWPSFLSLYSLTWLVSISFSMLHKPEVESDHLFIPNTKVGPNEVRFRQCTVTDSVWMMIWRSMVFFRSPWFSLLSNVHWPSFLSLYSLTWLVSISFSMLHKPEVEFHTSTSTLKGEINENYILTLNISNLWQKK